MIVYQFSTSQFVAISFSFLQGIKTLYSDSKQVFVLSKKLREGEKLNWREYYLIVRTKQDLKVCLTPV
jgi:hypothetical protein